MKFDLSKLKNKVNASSPEILIGLALAGFAGSTVMAVKATPKAVRLIEEEKVIRKENKEPEMTKMDVVKIAWKPYIPSLAFYTLSAACVLGSNHMYAKRNSAMIAAYKLTERAYTEYKDAVVEQIGEVKEKEIVDRISERRLVDNPSSSAVIVGTGDALFYDTLSGRYFRSTMSAIEKSIIDMNFLIINDLYASVNDLYELYDIEYTAAGHEMGWNTSNKLEVYYSAKVTPEGNACIVINYANHPTMDFNKTY
ncbi:MAG: DUF6353 family protein [Sarcina sp.]